MALSELPPPPQDEVDHHPELRGPVPGPLSLSSYTRLEKVEAPVFLDRRSQRQQPRIMFAQGRGANLYDLDGNRFVDLAAGFGALVLGHRPRALLRSIEVQSERMLQGLGDVYPTDAKVAALERIAALVPGKDNRVMLGQSGSDAVTIALKTAALATGRPGVLGLEGGYHGLGYGPLAVCGLRDGYRQPFAAQLNPHARLVRAPRTAADEAGSLRACEEALRTGNIGALVLEPIQGRAGCIPLSAEFLHAAAQLAQQFKALVIADEIWTGMGRAGSMSRTAELNVPVDLTCFGKGLGGGIPISACVGADALLQTWVRSPEVTHTSTFTGAPLACAAAVATIDAVRFKALGARARKLGQMFRDALRSELAAEISVQGDGLMVGIDVGDGHHASQVVTRLLSRGYVVLQGGGSGSVLTLTPPLTIDEGVWMGAVGPIAEEISRRA